MIDVEKLARESDCTHVNLSGDMPMATERLSRFAALVLEQAAIACDSIETDRWALYKGRPPYTGREPGRASDYTQGESDGACTCGTDIRAMKPEAK